MLKNKLKSYWLQVLLKIRFTKNYLFLKRKQNLSDDEKFLVAIYRAYLGRDPDASGLQTYLVGLKTGQMSRKQVTKSIGQSFEFKAYWYLQLQPGEALHSARIELVQNHIPAGNIIVDLGGATAHSPEGALLLMGYPHTPQQITIVDLPIEQRLGDWENQEPPSLVTAKGTHIRYLYRSLADLEPIANSSVDLVMSGESIEHVSEADAEQAIAESFRILKSGGYLCLDTPNRALTILHSPNQLIHPEHQKEYLVHELKEKVERQGFEVINSKSICPMPISLATGSFDWLEMVQNCYVGDKPEEGYLFFLLCRKP